MVVFFLERMPDDVNEMIYEKEARELEPIFVVSVMFYYQILYMLVYVYAKFVVLD